MGTMTLSRLPFAPLTPSSYEEIAWKEVPRSQTNGYEGFVYG